MYRGKTFTNNIDATTSEKEPFDVPELYSSMQNKIMSMILRARYSSERIRTFLHTKKTHYSKKGSTARNLLELLGRKEEEITDLKEKHHELQEICYGR
jgi:hypothetical protein